ncbi:hypothetical protein QUC31_007821 [Theobroma cacao]
MGFRFLSSPLLFCWPTQLLHHLQNQPLPTAKGSKN